MPQSKTSLDGDEIAEAFGHFLPLNRQHPIMHPKTRQSRPVMGTSALGAFIFVMGENQIIAAAMEVNGDAQMPLDHRRTFNMPARTTETPRASPNPAIRAARASTTQNPPHRV